MKYILQSEQGARGCRERERGGDVNEEEKERGFVGGQSRKDMGW